MRVLDGATATPGYSFVADPNTGLYRPGADRIRVVTGGTDQWEVDASGHWWPVTTNARDIGKTSQSIRDLYMDGVLQGGAALPISWSPAITASGGGFVLGTGGTADGWYQRWGRWTFGEGRVSLGNGGGASGGAGTYTITIPISTDGTYYAASALGATRHPIGTWTTRRDSTGAIFSGILRLGAATTSTNIALNISAGGTVGAANLGDGGAVAVEDEFFIQFGYFGT